jgi:hypothetical protein
MIAQSDADTLREQTLHVGLGAVEVGLEDGAEGAGEPCVEALGHREGALGVGRALHIDADEVVFGRGVGDHLSDDSFRQFIADIHADLGELDADVGVELPGGDLVEEAVVDGGGGFGVGDVGDAFAERVERGGDALGVETRAGGDSLFHRHAGDEALRDFAADRRSLRKGAEGLVGGECDEEGTEHAEFQVRASVVLGVGRCAQTVAARCVARMVRAVGVTSWVPGSFDCVAHGDAVLHFAQDDRF